MAIQAKVQHKGVVIDKAILNVDLLNVQKDGDKHIQFYVINIYSQGEFISSINKSCEINTGEPTYSQVYAQVKLLPILSEIIDV